jgi:predicted dehydrogenase
MSNRLSRRRFLQASAVAGAFGFWPGGARADDDKPSADKKPTADKKPSANEKLHVGVIGIAGQGAYDLNEVYNSGGAEIVALCDVIEGPNGAGLESNPRLRGRGEEVAKTRERFPQAKFYTDFRKLLEQKGLDAAVIATPDHTHAVATMAALHSGLHVYCEKPLTHTVSEARLVAETAAKQKRVTQMGTQIHAGGNYRRVVELIQSGAIGPIKEVHVWCQKTYPGGDRPKDKPPVPAGFHWDLWLGPAPDRPYHPVYLPFDWRGWWDFGGGTLADMACHYTDLPFWALKLRHPTSVHAEGSPTPARAEGAAQWLIVHYEFPARGDLPPVKLTWYDGGKRPKYFQEEKLPSWGDGVLFVGEKGMLLADYGNHKLLPEKDFTGFKPPKPFIKDSIGHHKEWVEACKTGGPTTCNFDYAGALTETVLLGNVSYRIGKGFSWDAKSLQASEPEAERFIQHQYRKGWTL